MAEVLILTDPHLKANNLDLVFDIFKQACQICNERRIKTIICAGDVFTVRTGLTLEVLLCFRKIVTLLRKNEIKFITIAGNHDKTNLSSESSYLDVFSNTGISVFKENDTLIVDKTTFFFIPYYPESSKYPEVLNGLLERDDFNNSINNKVLITHIAVDGVKNNGGGQVKNTLTKNLFSGFNKVLVGHYHNKSKVGKNIFYIGSTMPQDFGEDNEKGFTILNTSSCEMEFIQASFPLYITEYFDADDENYKKIIEQAIRKYRDSPNNIRFKISGNQETLEKIDKSKFLEAGILPELDNLHIIKNMDGVVEKKKISYDNASLTKMFFSYCKESEVDTEKTKKGLRIFRKAINESN